MQTDYVRYFIDVATLGSMSAAAKKNFMTPQSISRSITALESELGCELFLRDSNRVTLTRFGELLLKDALQLVEHESAMRRSIVDLHVESFEKKRLGFTCYSSPIFFDTPLFFPAFGVGNAHYKQVRFLQRSTSEAVEDLVESARLNAVDEINVAGLCFIDLFQEENESLMAKLRDAGYEYRPFMRTEDFVLVPAFSSLAEKEALSKEDILSYPLAIGSDEMAERIATQVIGQGRVLVATSDGWYRSHMCRMGEALAFVPGLSLVFGVAEGTVAVPMEEPYSIEIGFAAFGAAYREGLLADIIARMDNFYSSNEMKHAFTLLNGLFEHSMFSSSC